MSWKPKKWIAILLGFLLQPLGMLYIGNIKLASIYFIAGIFFATADFSMQINKIEIGQYFSFGLVLMFICASHIYFILRNSEGLLVRPWYSRWYGLASFPLVLFLSIYSFRAFLYEPFQIPASSMSPLLNPGDIMIASKWGYGNYGTYGITLLNKSISKNINRGDVVVFELPTNPSISYVKRVIGLPGDTVEYKKGSLIINSEFVPRVKEGTDLNFDIYTENLIGIEYDIKVMSGRHSPDGVVSVPNNHLFVMGDNRDNSNDSRYWGFVPLENIVGKMVYVF